MPFVHDDSIELPRLVQKNLPSGRVYMVESGEHTGSVYPSITRVLGAKPKPGLERWKKRVGHAKAAGIANAAAARGTSLHLIAESYLENKPLPTFNLSVAELWRYLRPWIDTHVTKVYGQETSVYSNTLAVAGRFDLLAEIDGQDLAIIDFKQSNRLKTEERVSESYYLQGTFYSCGIYELTGQKATRIIVPVVSPEGLQVFETRPSRHLPDLIARITDYYENYAETV